MAKDILMWVGGCYYKTPWYFIREAHEMGIIKRIPNVPNIECGVSKCFLLHQCGGKRPRCFGYFVISQVSVLVTAETLTALKEKYGDNAVYRSRSEFPDGDRGCEKMVVGRVYLCSPGIWEAAKKTGRNSIIKGSLHVFDEPWPMLSSGYPHFRGYSYIESHAFLAGLKWPTGIKTRL